MASDSTAAGAGGGNSARNSRVWTDESFLPHSLSSVLETTTRKDESDEAAAAAVLRDWSRSVQSDARVWIDRLTGRSGQDEADAASASSSDTANLEWVDPVSGCSAIHFAARSGSEAFGGGDDAAIVVADLIRRGADSNKPCAHAHMTPLHYAAFYGCAAVVKALLHSRSTTGQVRLFVPVAGCTCVRAV